MIKNYQSNKNIKVLLFDIFKKCILFINVRVIFIFFLAIRRLRLRFIVLLRIHSVYNMYDTIQRRCNDLLSFFPLPVPQ